MANLWCISGFISGWLQTFVITNISLTIFMYLLCSASVYTAVLGPGDMLTVPPFWLHHVETLEESVSVNVWSDSPEYATINDM